MTTPSKEQLVARLERAADRARNAGDKSAEVAALRAAEAARRAFSDGDAQQIHDQFIRTRTAESLRFAPALGAGEYDLPAGPAPGTHIERRDFIPFEIPNGFHISNDPGPLHLDPDDPGSDPPDLPFPPPDLPPPPSVGSAPPAPAEPPPPAPPEVPTYPSAPAPAEHGGGGQANPGAAPKPAPTATPISAMTGKLVANTALQVAANYKVRRVAYKLGGDASQGGQTSDCSHFVRDVLTQSGVAPPGLTITARPGPFTISKSSAFQKVTGPPQAGDIVVEQTGPNPQTDWHMGIYLGVNNAQGAPVGMQMGQHTKPTVGPAGMAWSSGPWGSPTFYRPVK